MNTTNRLKKILSSIGQMRKMYRDISQSDSKIESNNESRDSLTFFETVTSNNNRCLVTKTIGSEADLYDARGKFLVIPIE